MALQPSITSTHYRIPRMIVILNLASVLHRYYFRYGFRKEFGKIPNVGDSGASRSSVL